MDTLRVLSVVAQEHGSTPPTPSPLGWRSDFESADKEDEGRLTVVAPSESPEAFFNEGVPLGITDETEKRRDEPDLSYLNVLGGVARVETENTVSVIGATNETLGECFRYDSCESSSSTWQPNNSLNVQEIKTDIVEEPSDHSSLRMASCTALTDRNPDPVPLIGSTLPGELLVQEIKHTNEGIVQPSELTKPSEIEATFEGTAPVLTVLNTLSGNVSLLDTQQTVPQKISAVETRRLIAHESTNEHRVQLILILAMAVFFVSQSDLNSASPYFPKYFLSHVQRTILQSSGTRESLTQLSQQNKLLVDSSITATQDTEDSSYSFTKKGVDSLNSNTRETLQDDGRRATEISDEFENFNGSMSQITSTVSSTDLDTEDDVLIDDIHSFIRSSRLSSAENTVVDDDNTPLPEIPLHIPSLADKLELMEAPTPLVVPDLTVVTESTLTIIAPDSLFEGQGQRESISNCEPPVQLVVVMGVAAAEMGSENRKTSSSAVSASQNEGRVEAAIITEIGEHETTAASTNTTEEPLPAVEPVPFYNQDVITQDYQPSSYVLNATAISTDNGFSGLDKHAATLDPQLSSKISVSYSSSILEHFSSRIDRLEHIVKERPELVTSYQSMLSGGSSPMEHLSWYAWRVLVSRHLLPTSDKECRWSFSKERCEPVEKCAWQYKFGDFSPSRACRTRITRPDSLAKPEVAAYSSSQAPAQKALRQLTKKIQEVVRISKAATTHVASKWLPSFEDAIKVSVSEDNY